jgi:hypothetical protein
MPTFKAEHGTAFLAILILAGAVWYCTKRASQTSMAQANAVTTHAGEVTPFAPTSTTLEYDDVTGEWSTPYYLRANYPAMRGNENTSPVVVASGMPEVWGAQQELPNL